MTTQEVTARPATADRIAEAVYSHVKSKITDGRIRPHEMLIEIEIAEELGVSRSPVREALQRLVADGLVDLARRRWIVHEFTEDEIVEIYQVRAALESTAAKLAATEITDEQRTELLRFREKFQRTVQNDLEQRVYRNSEFHAFVTECSNNRRLIHFTEMNNTYHFNYDLASLYSRDDFLRSAQRHIALADAVLDGDGQRASEIVEMHVNESLNLLRAKIFQRIQQQQ